VCPQLRKRFYKLAKVGRGQKHQHRLYFIAVNKQHQHTSSFLRLWPLLPACKMGHRIVGNFFQKLW
jgi:hypothetical protein